MLGSYSTLVVLVALSAVFAFSFYAVLVAGQLSLGQAGFASIGGLIAAATVPEQPLWGFVPPLVSAIVIGVVLGAVAAFLLGLPVMRLRGVFLAIATLGFGEMVRIVMINMPWTGGAQGVSTPKLVTPLIVWIAVAVLAYFFARQSRSRLGRAMAAIREDELAARAMGIDAARHKMIAIVTAGAIAGLYGVLTAYFTRLITPGDFGFEAAVDGLVTAMVGGVLLFIGPVLGGAFLNVIPEVQRMLDVQAGWIRPFISGLLLLLVILFLPGGISALIPGRRRLRAPARPAAGRDPGPDPGSALGLRPLPPEGTPIVELLGIGKTYGGVHAVRQVDLRICSGEVLGLIGPNGAGKTTLVNMISGLVSATSGSGTVLGLSLGRGVAAHKFAMAGVSRTFQHSKLWNRLSALDNVLVGAHVVSRPTFLRRLLWLPSARRDEERVTAHAWRQLQRVGLAEHAATWAGQLSYGDQRRLEIARALAAHPTLLILDEPAAGMNHVEARGLSELIRSLSTDGITILLIEHNVGMVLSTCTRVMVLNFGEVIASGDPRSVARDPVVIDAYLGTEDSAAEGGGDVPVPTGDGSDG